MKMTKTIKHQGTTLIELVVVLALTSMIVLSLCLLTDSMSTITNKNAESEEKIKYTTEARDFITNWFSYYDDSESSVSISEGNIAITENGNDYHLYRRDNELVAEYEDGDRTYIYGYLESVSFSVFPENDRLYECVISYKLGEEPSTYQFLLSRRTEYGN